MNEKVVLRGGPWDGVEVDRPLGRWLVFPAAEDCGRVCSPHFSQWEYDTQTGEFYRAFTYLGDPGEED